MRVRRRGTQPNGEPFPERDSGDMSERELLDVAESILDAERDGNISEAELAEVEAITAAAGIANLRDRETVDRYASGNGAGAGDWLGRLSQAEEPQFTELRGRCRLGRWLRAATGGEVLDGAEAELAAELGGGPRRIPFAMFEPPASRWAAYDRQIRADASTGVPGTVGVNMAPIVPALFARSVADRLGLSMPSVPSGTHSVPRISANLTAAARQKGSAFESTAATIAVASSTPHRVTGRLTTTIEDIAMMGTGSFEQALRDNLRMVLNAELDNLILNGDPSTTAAEPQGLIDQFTPPANPGAVVTWKSGIDTVAAGIDGGPWAESLADIRLLANPETLRHFEGLFRVPEGTEAQGYATPGETSLAAYLRTNLDMLFSSARMPDTDSTIALGLMMRLTPRPMGAAGQTTPMAMGEVPTWGMVMIDDPYTDAGSGTLHVTVSALVGDVALRHPDAYQLVKFDLS